MKRTERNHELYRAMGYYWHMLKSLKEEGKIKDYKKIGNDPINHALHAMDITLENGRVCRVTTSDSLAKGVGNLLSGWTPKK